MQTSDMVEEFSAYPGGSQYRNPLISVAIFYKLVVVEGGMVYFITLVRGVESERALFVAACCVWSPYCPAK